MGLQPPFILGKCLGYPILNVYMWEIGCWGCGYWGTFILGNWLLVHIGLCAVSFTITSLRGTSIPSAFAAPIQARHR